jgi:Arc/MetJ-type ribon-helix-helix transcriptional regulator
MKKRRVTLNLDEDIIEYLESIEGRSMSAVANDALREALELEAHRRALLDWLDELNERYGSPTPEDYAWANEVLDEAYGHRDTGTSAA